MKLLVDKFCSLSTSPVWQAWLFHFNADVYKRFIKRLLESRGCAQNKELMVELLAEIEKIDGGSDKLFTFLKAQYPYIIADEQTSGPQRVRVPEIDEQTKASMAAAARGMIPARSRKTLFEDYVPGMMTYPRRMIFEGPVDTLKTMIKAFTADKIVSEHIIHDGRAYIEYLTSNDAYLKDSIPEQNWQIRAWRAQT